MNLEKNSPLPMRSGDKVVCIDAGPPPKYGLNDAELDDFFYPDGFVEEGMIYCVEHAFEFSQNVYGLFLIGKRAFCQGEEIGWYWRRFRVVGEQRDTRKADEVRKQELERLSIVNP